MAPARRRRSRDRAPAVLVAGLAAACSGGGRGADLAVVDPPDAAALAAEGEAARFLTQATFGPTPEGIRDVLEAGYGAWIDRQLARAPSLARPALEGLGCAPELGGAADCDPEAVERLHLERTELWWQHALYAPDELRQRVAFAWSELFVVSARSDALRPHPLLAADYYDSLAAGAFGTYRELLEDVALHPAMGLYLGFARNPKPVPELALRPDENFAREVMQLFSIGLVELRPDGTPVLGDEGAPVPTYDQAVVEGMARALTGWNFRGADGAQLGQWLSARPRLGRLEPWDEYHDGGSKLVVGGERLPAGLGAAEDLALVLDLLADHPSTGPFVARHLIQRLVTSNPSPAYVARVAAVFADDGTGVRGDLGAVVRAVLLDPEARGGQAAAGSAATFGKVREPLLRLTALWRAFDARTESGRVGFPWMQHVFGQAPLGAPSVFNFFRPDFAPPGPLRDAGLVAPELQITTHSAIARVANFLGHASLASYVGTSCGDCSLPRVDYSRAAELAADPALLVDFLDARLLGGTMSAAGRAVLVDYAAEVPAAGFGGLPPGWNRVREAVHLVVVSPGFAVEE